MPRDDDPDRPAQAETEPGAHAPGNRDRQPPKRRSKTGLAAYQLGASLGKGGMGEVVVGHDKLIGRDVAVKRLRGAQPNAAMQDRFLREARIQARLDHPAIVPVYEVGLDDDGKPYFTMKRLSGVTLSDVLVAPNKPPRPRLLRAFVDICHAVEFAHSRGIVHRDLKPSNIVLGKFSEVYVLDWGLARVICDNEDQVLLTPGDIDSVDGLTQAGALLGTPGYMAPEQARGESDIERPADVYALGSILFEILTGEALHPKGDRAIASTIENLSPSPMTRRPDAQIAPELDVICVAALATEPELRPTAGELAERIERYLDGDRDVVRRRELALDHLASARAARAIGNRVIALRAAGRALALDPDSREAAEIVTGLILEPPRELPPDLQYKLDQEEVAFARRMGRIAAVVFAFGMTFLPFAFLLEVKSWPIVIAIFGAFAALGIHAELAFRTSTKQMYVALVGMSILMMLLTRLFGPFIFVPGLICTATLGLSTYPRLIDRPKLVTSLMLLGIAAPLVFESLGWWTSTWSIEHGSIVTTSSILEYSGSAGTAMLLSANLALIAIGGWFARQLAVDRRKAQHRLEIQAWHLRQLLPEH